MKKYVADDSIFELLFVYRLLFEGAHTIEDIQDEFLHESQTISAEKILSCIKALKKYGVKVEAFKLDTTVSYRVSRQGYSEIKFSKEELRILSDVKKLLVARKNYDSIQSAIKFLYKVAFFVKDTDKRQDVTDFGYFSTLNWFMITKLKEHCKNKDIIVLDYITPEGKGRYITFHADNLELNPKSNRLYLNGVYKEKSEYLLASLPVDRIFMIKKVIKKQTPFDIRMKVITYKISKKMYESIKLEKEERVLQVQKKFVTIQRIVENEFKTVQKLLTYCPQLYYVSDDKIRNILIEKLEILKENYEKTQYN